MMRCVLISLMLLALGCASEEVPEFVDAHWQLVCPFEGPLDCPRAQPHDLFGYEGEPNDIHGDEGTLSVRCNVSVDAGSEPGELRVHAEASADSGGGLSLDYFQPGLADAPIEGMIETSETPDRCDVATEFLGNDGVRETGDCGVDEECVIGPSVFDFHDGVVDIQTRVICTELSVVWTGPGRPNIPGHHLELGRGAPPGTPATIELRNCEDRR